MTKQRKAKFRVGQVVMLTRPEFEVSHSGVVTKVPGNGWCVWVGYAGLNLKICTDSIRRLTIREAVPAAKKAGSRR